MNLLVLPVLVPMVAAASSLLLWKSVSAQRLVALLGALGLALVNGMIFARTQTGEILVLGFGNWPAPFGIAFVADRLAGIMLLATGVIAVAVQIYSFSGIDSDRESFGFYPLTLILLMGVSGAFLTGDIFNLYVWFEVLLIASFVLMSLGGERLQLQGAVKYVTLNLVSSALFLTALGLLNGSLGTLNMAHLSERVAEAGDPGFTTALAVLFLVAFSIKSALFPLYGWLPASYHTPPAAVSALFAGLLTKVGVYALIRTFTLIFTQDPGFTHQLVLLPLAAMTILAGGMGFWVQHDMRRAFAFAIVASVGVALVGLAMTGIPGSEAARTLALAGALAYVFQTMLVKAQLFLMAGIVRRAMGSCDLRTIGGLAATAPWLAAMAMIGLLAFAGVPPLSGFAPKVAVLRASLDLQQGWVAACILAGSVLALAGVARIWSEAFWKKPLHRPDESEQDQPANALARIVPVTGLALCIVALGLGAGPVFDAAEAAARQLLDPSTYIRAVLGGGP